MSDNTASDGGGVHVDTTGKLTMNGGSVTENTATYTGGGLATYGTTSLGNVTVSENDTENFEGAGVFAGAGALTVNTSRFVENSAASNGGGIANFGATVRLTSTTVADNAAVLGGGGLYNFGGTSTLIGGTVTGNTAGEQGGGVLRDGGTVVLTGATVTGNTPDQCAPPGAVPGCAS